MTPFGNFKIYPRGFLGATRSPVLVKKSGSKRNQSLQYDNTLFDTNDTKVVVANTDIESLYERHVRGEATTERFAFRDEILQQVLWAFGTTDFEGWYKVQYNSPSFGVDHRDFLDDCLHFLMEGKRARSLYTWDVMLDPTDTRCQEDTLSDNARRFFHKEFVSNLAPQGKMLVSDVVAMWCAQHGGINDLLFTAHILFGLKK
jgi:hypothetical protein